MKLSVSDNAKALMVDAFQVDAAGKPLAEFQMKHGPAPRNEVLKQHHCLKAYPVLQAIDVRIDHIVANLGESGHDVGQLMNDWQVLAAHASKVMAQAIYLDTSDRNSWEAIRQTMVHELGNEKFQSRYSIELQKFWHGNMDHHLQPRSPEREASLGI